MIISIKLFLNCLEKGTGFSFSTSLKTGPGFTGFTSRLQQATWVPPTQREMLNEVPPGLNSRDFEGAGLEREVEEGLPCVVTEQQRNFICEHKRCAGPCAGCFLGLFED